MGKISQFRRTIILVVLAIPLLSTGTCLTIAQDAVINGFFNAVTPLLIDQAATAWGLTTTSNQVVQP